MVDPGDQPVFDQNLARKALGEVAKPADDGRTRNLTLPGTLATANELKTILAALRHRPTKADFATALAAVVSACIAIFKALGSKLPDGGWHIDSLDVAFIVLSAVALAVAIIRYINARYSTDPLTDEAIRMVVENMKSEGQLTEEQAKRELAQTDKPTPMVVQYVLLALIIGVAIWKGPGTAAVIGGFLFLGNLIEAMRKRAAGTQPAAQLRTPGALRAKAAELVAKAEQEDIRLTEEEQAADERNKKAAIQAAQDKLDQP
jgi:hypothetical protein